MTVFFDTSVLVAALVDAHPMHGAALPWLRRVHAGTLNGVVAAHGMAETFSVLSTLPHQPRITAEIARQLIRASVATVFRVIPLAKRDYLRVIDTLARAGLSGGIVYDALAMQAASKAKADRVVTLNGRDFSRLADLFHVEVTPP